MRTYNYNFPSKKNNYIRNKIIFILGFVVFANSILAQENIPTVPPSNISTQKDSLSNPSQLYILPGTGKLEMQQLNDSVTLQILANPVKLKQGKTLFFCDSCVINQHEKMFQAFGKIHIIDNDSIHVYGSYLKYLIDKKLALLENNVKLNDKVTTLTTSKLQYDMLNEIATYNDNAKIVRKSTTITSKEGMYFTDIKDAIFKKNVFIKDSSYTLTTDSVAYNLESSNVRFITKTLIVDSSNRKIETSDGFYNLNKGYGEFGKRTIIRDKTGYLTGDKIINNDSIGIVKIKGRGLIVDTAQKTTLQANYIEINKKTESSFATEKPILIIKNENDSTFIGADSFYMFKDSVLQSPPDDTLTTKKDSVLKKMDSLFKNKKIEITKKDSVKTNNFPKKYVTFNLLKAYHHVKIFSDSLQSVCDSLIYTTRDSSFHLYNKPIVWSKENQITGDTIFVVTKNKKPHYIEVIDNAIFASQLQKNIFNQIGANKIMSYYTAGELDSIQAKSSVQCIYYLQDEQNNFSGINKTSSQMMTIYFKDRELSRISFINNVQGDLLPIRDENIEEAKLSKMVWYENLRPKSRKALTE